MNKTKTKSGRSQTSSVSSSQSGNVGQSLSHQSPDDGVAKIPVNMLRRLAWVIPVLLVVAVIVWSLVGDGKTKGKEDGNPKPSVGTSNPEANSAATGSTGKPTPSVGKPNPDVNPVATGSTGKPKPAVDKPNPEANTGTTTNNQRLLQAISFDNESIEPGKELTGTIVLKANVSEDTLVKISCGETNYPDVIIRRGSNTSRIGVTLPDDYVGADVRFSAKFGTDTVKSVPIKVLRSSEPLIDWQLPLTILSLFIAVGSMVYSFVSLQRHRRVSGIENQAYIDRIIAKRMPTNNLDSSPRVPSAKVTLFGDPPSGVDDRVSVKQFEDKLRELKEYIDNLDKTSRLKLESQIDDLGSKVAKILETIRYQPSVTAEVPTTLPNPIAQQFSPSTSILSIDERQKLLYIQDLLSQPVVSYGRVTLATKPWGTFGTELKKQIRAMIVLADPTVTIIEPELGDAVDEGMMEIGLVPATYQMRVREVVSLGIRSTNTGDFFKAKVIVE